MLTPLTFSLLKPWPFLEAILIYKSLLETINFLLIYSIRLSNVKRKSHL